MEPAPGTLEVYLGKFNDSQMCVSVNAPTLKKKFGVKVERYNEKTHSQLPGLATFEVRNVLYASCLEWYGLAYGFTAETLKTMDSDQRSPSALGQNIVHRMTAAVEKYLKAKKVLSPVMSNTLWRKQLAKTILYVERNGEKLKALPKPGEKYEIINKNGVFLLEVNRDADGPGFKIVKTQKELFVRIRRVLSRIDEEEGVVPLSSSKRYFDEFELYTNTFVVRVKSTKNTFDSSYRRWPKELEVANLLIQENEKKADLTGLLVPLYVIRNQIIYKKGSGDLLDKINAGELSFEDKIRVACDLSKGISTVHALNYAHRDIKPPNAIWFPKERTVGLMDHEFACKSEGKANHQLLGTPGFFGPEVLRGFNNVDAKKLDSVAFGISLYMLFTGKVPSFYLAALNFEYFEEYLKFLNDLKTPRVIMFLPLDIKHIIIDLLNIDLDQRETVTNAHLRLKKFQEQASKDSTKTRPTFYREVP